ncbi:MAG: XRE family transcriptional regulator [Chloroflexi bacterium]|nr:MAG: XRE family transcriptional regulator [Chloroflexota bacterium]
MKKGSKYFPLYTHLKQCLQQEVVLTLTDIETLIELPLPGTAHLQRAWWSNRSKGALQAQAWMQAGYHVVEIDLENGKILFRRPKLNYEAKKMGDTVQWDGELISGLRHHMDLTQGELADVLGVRQQTISEWERSAYLPSRATSKYLSMVAEREGFTYEVVPNEPDTE